MIFHVSQNFFSFHQLLCWLAKFVFVGDVRLSLSLSLSLSLTLSLSLFSFYILFTVFGPNISKRFIAKAGKLHWWLSRVMDQKPAFASVAAALFYGEPIKKKADLKFLGPILQQFFVWSWFEEKSWIGMKTLKRIFQSPRYFKHSGILSTVA